MERIISLVTTLGALAPAMSTAPIRRSALATAFDIFFLIAVRVVMFP